MLFDSLRLFERVGPVSGGFHLVGDDLGQLSRQFLQRERRLAHVHRDALQGLLKRARSRLSRGCLHNGVQLFTLDLQGIEHGLEGDVRSLLVVFDPLQRGQNSGFTHGFPLGQVGILGVVSSGLQHLSSTSTVQWSGKH